MKTRSVSYLKAHLSEELRGVQEGEEIVVTDRDRPVAKLVPYVNPARHNSLERLERAGLARAGRGIDEAYWSLPEPGEGEAGLLDALRAEREEGW